MRFLRDKAMIALVILSLAACNGGPEDTEGDDERNTDSDPPTFTLDVADTGSVGQPVHVSAQFDDTVDIDALNSRWYLSERPTGSESQMVDPQAISTEFTPDQPGTYQATFELSAAEQSEQASRVVVVEAATAISRNIEMASLEADRVVAIGESDTVTLLDADDAPVEALPEGLSLGWEFCHRPAGSNVELREAEDPSAGQAVRFSPDTGGRYCVEATVRRDDVDTGAAGDVATFRTERVAVEDEAPLGTAGIALPGNAGTAIGAATFDWSLEPEYGVDRISEARLEEGLTRRVLRTEIVLEFAPERTVETVNRVLEELDGGIVSMVGNTDSVIVRIPDPENLEALFTLLESLEEDPAVVAADESVLARKPPIVDEQTDEVTAADFAIQALPNTIDRSDTTQMHRVDHHLAVRGHSAWNMEAALPDHLSNRPWLIVIDSFGDGPPNNDYAAVTRSGDFRNFNPKPNQDDCGWREPCHHGYHVLGIILGAHDGGADIRSDVTGIYPQSLRVRVYDASGINSIPRMMRKIIQRAKQIRRADDDANIVVNTSIGLTDPEERKVNRQARRYIKAIERNGLENHLVHAVSAGDLTRDGSSWPATRNSGLTYAALGDVTKAFGNTMANLDNILVVENRQRWRENNSANTRSLPRCLSNRSLRSGNVSAIGSNVFSFGRQNAQRSDGQGTSTASGTSMASPQSAGLAAMVWALNPGLSGPQVVNRMLDSTRDDYPQNGVDCHAQTAQPVIDALDALRGANRTVAARALMDVADASANAGANGRFDEHDISHLLASRGGSLSFDYGPRDLNGDGLTDLAVGSSNTEPVDLDGDGSRTRLTAQLIDRDARFDETAVTDLDLLCYDAFVGNAYQGDAEARNRLLGDDCGTVNVEITDVELIEPTAGTVSTGPGVLEPVRFQANVTGDEGRDLSYSWRFDDGFQGDGPAVGRIFREAGDVEVTLVIEAGDETAEMTETFTIEAPAPVGEATLDGLVLDADGNRLPLVEVYAADGNLLGTTDTTGSFSVDVPQGVTQVLYLRRVGWAEQIVRIRVPDGVESWPVQTQMVRRGEPMILQNANNGGEVEGPMGARVTFPQDAFVGPDGDPVVGDVMVSMTPVVTRGNSLGSFPGSFEAIRPSGETGRLSTYGVMEVDLTRNGEEVRLAEGATAELLIPMSTPAELGEEVALWSLDEASGIWIGEGTGTVVEASDAPAGVALKAQVGHFSWWNVDVFSQTSRVQINLVYPGGAPTNPPDAFNAVGGTPAEFAGPMSESDLRRVTVSGDERFPAPVGQPFRIEITSVDGRYRCSVEKRFAPNEAVDCELEAVVPDTADDALEIAYGETKTVDVSGDSLPIVFDGAAGDYVRVVASSEDGQAIGLIKPRSIFGQLLARRPFQPGEPARVIYLVPDSGRNTIELQFVTPGEVEVTIDKLAGPTLQLEQSQQVTLDPSQDREWIFWGNAGTEVHAFAWGQSRPSLDWELEVNGEEVSGERANYGGNSRLFEISETGLHLLRLETTRSYLTETLDHNISLTVVESAEPLALGDGSARLERRVWVPGKLHRFEFVMQGGESVFARPTRLNDDETQPRMKGTSLTEITVHESDDKDLGSVATYRASQVFGTTTSIDSRFEVFYAPGETGRYQMEVERMDQRATVVVGPEDADPETCLPDTAHVNLAAFAIDNGGTIELCPGVHETYAGLFILGQRVHVVGPDEEEASLRSWPGEPVIGPGGLARLENVTLAPGRNNFANAVAAKMDQDLARAPLEIREVRVLAPQRGGPQTLFQLFGTSEDTDANSVTIEDLAMLGPAEIGIEMIGSEGVRLERVELTGPMETGVAALGGSDVVIRDFTATDVERGIDVKNVFGATIERAEIELSDDMNPERFGIRLRSDTRGRLTAGGAITVSESSIRAGLEGDYGMFLNVQDASGGAAVERNRFYGSGLASVGLEVNSVGNDTASEVRIQNNVFLNHREKGIRFNNMGDYDEVRIINNTIRQEGDYGFDFDAVYLDVVPTGPPGTLRIYNNILAGFDSVDDDAVVFTRGLPFEADYNLFRLVGRLYVQGTSPLNPALNDIPSTPNGTQLDPRFDGLQSGSVEPSSPAIDNGTDIWAPDRDIEGIMRPVGSAVDIGAYEQ